MREERKMERHGETDTVDPRERDRKMRADGSWMFLYFKKVRVGV